MNFTFFSNLIPIRRTSCSIENIIKCGCGVIYPAICRFQTRYLIELGKSIWWSVFHRWASVFVRTSLEYLFKCHQTYFFKMQVGDRYCTIFYFIPSDRSWNQNAKESILLLGMPNSKPVKKCTFCWSEFPSRKTVYWQFSPQNMDISCARNYVSNAYACAWLYKYSMTTFVFVNERQRAMAYE